MKKYRCFSFCNTKALMFRCIISAGFVTLIFLGFMLLLLNDYNGFSRNIIKTDNIPLYVPKSFRIQNLDVLQEVAGADQAENKKQMPGISSQYKYMKNEPTKCNKSDPFLILLVPVQAWQKEARQAIRQTWGREDFVPGVTILRLFLLGTEATPNNDVEQYLAAESQQFHDIIQQDFLDTYNNLTLKTLMGMHWVATYCPQAHYVMKADIDMFINTEYLVQKLLKPDQPIKENYFTGNIMKGYLPNRNKESKWYMSEELYPGDQYPIFCSGTSYVFSGDLAAKILRVSQKMRKLPLEDVFVGICLDKLGLSPVPPPKESEFNHWKVTFSVCAYNSLVSSHAIEPSELIAYWNNLQQNKHTCDT